ncbi:MAG: AAA+ family ATPase [Rhodobacteraceae bacterium]|nr:AAA+ family ATPase [Paracoccaceae bacterium]
MSSTLAAGRRMGYNFAMRPILIISLCLCLNIAPPAFADDVGDLPNSGQPEGFFDLIERMMRGFFDDMDPHMRQMERSLEAAEPELRRFLGQLRDMVEYEPPEILPNGDILIRRRHPTNPDVDAPDQAVPAPSDEDAPSAPDFEL